jgi:hypothetical protein
MPEAQNFGSVVVAAPLIVTNRTSLSSEFWIIFSSNKLGNVFIAKQSQHVHSVIALDFQFMNAKLLILSYICHKADDFMQKR